jgi:hypothetical protein
MNRSAALLLSVVAFPSLAFALESPQVMPNLRVPEGERLAFVLKAEGVQVYECKARPDDASAYAWSFTAPEAALMQDGALVGRHFAGPTWASANDGSSVKGAVREKQDGGAGNIPWLLLSGKSEGSSGRFAGITSVQRVATRGGVEPADACNAASAGRQARVPYTADYYFYKA